MKTLLPVLAGLLAIGALTYLRANHHRPHFEADLTSRTQAALTAIPIPKADVSAEGQIILRGEVASEELKAPGVEELRNLLTVSSVPTPKVLITEEKVTAVNRQVEFSKLLGREQIRFVTGKAIVNPTSYPLLNNLAAISGKCPAVSKGRADAVVDYLVQKGVPTERMSSVGYGPNEPVADNKTPQGRQKNRRTEFKGEGNLA